MQVWNQRTPRSTRVQAASRAWLCVFACASLVPKRSLFKHTSNRVFPLLQYLSIIHSFSFYLYHFMDSNIQVLILDHL